MSWGSYYDYYYGANYYQNMFQPRDPVPEPETNPKPQAQVDGNAGSTGNNFDSEEADVQSSLEESITILKDILSQSEGLLESNKKLIRRVLCEIETWMDGAEGGALDYNAQLALPNTEKNPTVYDSTVEQPKTGETEEGKCSLVGYLSLLRTVRANEGFSDNEKEVLRTEIERTDEFLAAPENAAMDTANTRHLSSIQAVCDGLVARYSIAMAIRLVKLSRPSDSLKTPPDPSGTNFEDLTETGYDLGTFVDGILRSMTNNAGVECIERFKQTGEIKDLEEAILQLNEVLDHTPSSSAERPVCLCNLSSAFTSRFARFGEVKDVDSAIERLREAVSLTPLDSVDRPDRLTNLGISYQDRFKRRAEVKDIDSAIESQCEAVNLTPLDSADRPGRLTNLGNAFVCRFERVGEVKDIDSAIERHNEAVSLTALDNEKRPVFLNNLGISFQSRFERFGEVKDIDSAIQRQSEAVSLSPLDSAVRPGHISNLGSAFCCRFNLLEEVKDIDSAIERHSEAVSLTPLDSADRPACLNNLGISFQTRFERFVEVQDIDSAIERHREAVNLTPADNAERLGRLSNLGNSFLDRFELLGEVKDIDSAFEHLHEALSLTPPDSADRPGRLSNLGICLQHRFERFGEIKDINSAIEWKSEAVDLTPLDAADRPRCLHSLADSLLHRFRRLGDVKDFSQGVHALRTSSLSPNGKPISRIRSALLWAHLMHTYDLTMAIEAYDQAIGLLPQVVWVGLSALTQLERLTSKIQSLACDAAACMISLAQSKPDHEQYYLGRAVELLDQGRSVLWSQASSLKQDLKTLHKVNSQLAEDLDRIGKALGQSCFRNSKDMLSETDAQLFRRYAENWDELVCRVRKLPGFDHFLLPSPISKLRHAADGGPVVIVNSCEFRCDALIVSRHGNLVLVPFSKEKKATIEGLISQQQLFASARSTRLSRPKQESIGRRVEPLQVLLYQTWSLLGEPIVRQLKNLGVIGSEPLSTCRVWWCLTGSLTFLPIHASLPRPRGAGGNTLGMMDIVVSSYTPTLSALLRSRRHTMPSSFHMLAVGQPNSRDHPPLYCVEAEMKAICDLLSPDRVTFLKGPDASVNAVAAAMPNCTWAHFACHGIQDQKQPMDSGLLMDNNHLLTLSHIAQSSLESAEFAFLSSCESATGSKELSNESVHLTAGLQFVGFRAVIGTMWTVADKDALIIAEQVYRELFKDGATRANVSNAAFALNRAVRYLRDEQKVPFAQWVPFVHFGS